MIAKMVSASGSSDLLTRGSTAGPRWGQSSQTPNTALTMSPFPASGSASVFNIDFLFICNNVFCVDVEVFCAV